MNLAITNVINVSVSQSPVGAGEYNTSNIALFSDEPYASSFGTLGYNIYLSATQVGIDFGTASKTYQMAVSIFSQQPNILQLKPSHFQALPQVEVLSLCSHKALQQQSLIVQQPHKSRPLSTQFQVYPMSP